MLSDRFPKGLYRKQFGRRFRVYGEYEKSPDVQGITQVWGRSRFGATEAHSILTKCLAREEEFRERLHYPARSMICREASGGKST